LLEEGEHPGRVQGSPSSRGWRKIAPREAGAAAEGLEEDVPRRFGHGEWILLPATAPASSVPTQHLGRRRRCFGGRRGCTEGKSCTAEMEKHFQLVSGKICACAAHQQGSRSGSYGRQAHSGEKPPRSEDSSLQKNSKNCWLPCKRREHK